MRNPIPLPGAEDGAMTEVALALAMGFFSILVLTLVSMGGGESPSYQAVRLVQTSTERTMAVMPESDDVIVIFDGERYLDTDLNPLDPAAVTTADGGRIILAVDPSLRLADVMAARARIAVSNLVIANLDERWRHAIEAAREVGRD